MKAITLHQPWATFVAMKWKTIETRKHSRFKGLVGQRIAIHAAIKTYPPSPLQAENLIRFIVPCRGKILCTAKVLDARWAPNVGFVEREEWNKRAMCEVAGKFCLFFGDIKPLPDRVFFRGRQGIFKVPDEEVE